MTHSIRQCLARARLLRDSDSARLDTELLLAAALGRDRTYLFTWPERALSEAQWQQFDHWMHLRGQGHPVAHLLGRREFWGLDLEVNAATLIPRPDTELLVELTLDLDVPAAARVLDLGTGSGAIALALASERPRWQLLAVDRSHAAVKLARRNCARLRLSNVTVLQSDWFAALDTDRFAVIVGNPPYISEQDLHLDQGDVRFEPRSALVAAGNGLDDLQAIVLGARDFLSPGGWLLLEHGYNQGADVRKFFGDSGYCDVATHRDLGGNPRVTRGRVPLRRAPLRRAPDPSGSAEAKGLDDR